MNDNHNSSAPPLQVQPITISPMQVFSVGDAGKKCRRSPSWVRQIANELKLEPQRTANGTRIFSGQQVQRLAEEAARRELEALRR